MGKLKGLGELTKPGPDSIIVQDQKRKDSDYL
jgi:hypothetical protein